MVDRKCPNDCGQMVTARHKDVEFSTYDDAEKCQDITVTIYATWCPECGYCEISQ